jgi:hypothetical protein
MIQNLLVHHQGMFYCCIKRLLNNIFISCIWMCWGALGTVNTPTHTRAAPLHNITFLSAEHIRSTWKIFN